MGTVEIEDIVRRLREQGTDDGMVEVKACEHELGSSVWESVSAFANTAGGLIVLGLDERSGFLPVEGFELERVRDQFVSGMGDGGQLGRLANPPRYELSRMEVDGCQILVASISELDLRQKPCYIRARGIQGGSYKRIDDKDVRLSPSELFEMQGALLPNDAESALVKDARLADLDRDLLDTIISTRRRQSSRVFKGADTEAAMLERLGIMSGDGSIRLAGLLAAGLYPQQFYPRLLVDVAVHLGMEKSSPGKPRFIDRQLCDGPISACVESSMAVLARNLRKASHISGLRRRDEWEIPEEVLREALSNALLHREYAPLYTGEAVSVDVYPDRIEVRNPGGLWGGKTLDSLDDGTSRCRNPRLMSLMGAVPLELGGGYIVENQGSGIRFMLQEMKARSLPAPEFYVAADSFTVILRREAPGALTLGAPTSCPRALSTSEGAPPTKREDSLFLEQKILIELDGQRLTSARELAERIGGDIARIRYLLPKLIEQGKVAATAAETSRNRKYVLVS